ncbi:MAG TPA: M43 family zinc metalloprotease, partial [Saprospiraceae bacterium]|nr:M43 family zinc metalloprotease [Saprospiraceae bacterium]
FCLARRTPEGQATSGITRTVSPLTSFTMETQDLALKDLARWDPTRYINIWVVADINSLSLGAGVAGYAYFPSSHGAAEDGIVCEASFLGANPAGNAVLVHELGHYLGLYHTFQGGCPNADCLLDGDRVCDTPPDQAQHSVCPFNSCDTDADAPAPNPFSSDVDDPTSNFLDYSALECYAGFTAGQSVRMNNTIETARASLLDSDGCLDPCTQPITCAFSISPPVAYPGQQVQFNNQSTGANAYWWYINGSVLNQLENPTHTFPQPGVYLIELQANNGDPNCSGSFSLYYTVACPVEAAFTSSATLIQPGGSVIFTSTSSGATTWQWLINGVPASAAPVFNHTFDEAGIYTVVLIAGNGVCTDQTAVAIQVQAPCTGLMETGLYRSTDPVFDEILFHRNVFTQAGDIGAAGVLLGPPSTYKGIVAKWNGAAQIQWAKSAPGRYFHNIVEAPDGNWVLYAVGDPCVVAKIKPDGTVLWAKSFTMPSTSYTILSYDHLTILPNGDIAFVFSTNNNGEFLFRTDADGNVLWQKSFISFGGCNLSPAIDGSNNLRVISYSDNYILMAPNGQILEVKKPVFATNPSLNESAGFEKYNQHPDGSFSIWARTQSSVFGQGVVLYHFNPAGVLQWSRPFNNSSGQYFVRYYPGDGWLVTLNIDLKHVLYRLNEDSSVRWSKEFTGGGPAYVFTGFSGMAESPDGRVAGLNNLPYNTDAYLVVFDPNAADNCNLVNYAPGLTFTPPVSWQNDSHNMNVSSIPVADFNLVFEDIALDFEPQCTMPVNCPEICDNGLDDDADGLTDCADADCQCGPNNVCVPDAAVTFDSVVCEAAGLKVYLRICNTGGADFPAGTPLQFYLGDPTTGTAPSLGQPQYLPQKIAPNSCENLTITLPLPPNGTIFGMLNDDGSLPTPFEPEQDFPGSGLTECFYANNLFFFNLNYNPPTLDLGPDILLCNSSVVPLHGGNGFARYRWADGSADSVYTAYGPGTYWLDAWDVCGNLHTDTMHIAVQTALPLDLGPDRSICPGESIDFSVSGFEEVHWSPSTNFPCSDCPDVTVSPDSSITLRIT